MYNPPNAPLSIGGVLDEGFRLFKASFTKVFPLALLFSIVNIVPGLLMPTPAPGAAPEISAGLGAIFVLMMLLNILLFCALVAAIGAVAENSPVSIAAALTAGLRRFLPLMGCAILLGLATIAGTLLLVVPGLILMVTLSMAPYLVMVDGMGPLEAIKTSHRLVWGHWWRTATILGVTLFIVIAASILVALASGTSASMGIAVDDSGNVIATAAAVLINAVTVPLYYTFALAVLRDLQLRKLGTDLEQRIGNIGKA